MVRAAGSTTVLGPPALAGPVRIPLIAPLTEPSPAVPQRAGPALVPLAVVAALPLLSVVATGSRFAFRRVRAACAAVLEAPASPERVRWSPWKERAADAFAIPGLPARIGVTTGIRR
ncbi:hypothetical protein [Streptomyces sp. NPDC051109]|uniref:hypothetical protein n=1 Tax=Streptomyces sp. NPDC051109 TaxID=3365642 RepID=UPI0037BC1888